MLGPPTLPERFRSLSPAWKAVMLGVLESGHAPREYDVKTPPTHPSPDPPPAAPSYPTCERCGRAHYVGPTPSDPAYCHLNGGDDDDAH